MIAIVAASLAGAPTLAAQRVSAMTDAPGDSSLSFDRVDRESRDLIATIRCAQRVAMLRQRLAFGPLDSLGRRHQCFVADGRWTGIFFDADSALSRMTRSSVANLMTGARRQDPFDTTRVLAMERAEDEAQRRGAGDYAKANRAYAPITIRFDGDSIHVWLVPIAVYTGRPLTVGGERGYVFSPDGRTLARVVDAFDTMRTFTASDTGVVHIPSRGVRVPSLTEMFLANGLQSSGRRVAIDLRDETAMLVGDGAASYWARMRR